MSTLDRVTCPTWHEQVLTFRRQGLPDFRLILPRLPALVLALLVLIGLLAGCGGGDDREPVTSTAIVLDISGSAKNIELENSFNARVERELSELSSGSTLAVLTLDGGGLTAICPPVEVRMVLPGKNEDVRDQQRGAIAEAALQRTRELLGCATARAVTGSDLVGAINAAEGRLDSTANSRKLVLVSDGVQYTDELMFDPPENLTNPAWREQVLATLRQQGLLPDFTGVQLVITDLGAGAPMTASQAQGLRAMWEEYATAANSTLQ